MTANLSCVVSYCNQESIECAWESPNQGMVKLNTDGSLSEEHAGIGGLLRDYQGEVICFFNGSIEKGTVQLLELKAILVGLRISTEMGHKRVHIATDSRNAVQCIQGAHITPWYARETVKEIQELCEALEECKCTHVFRETNTAADYLAGRKGHKGITVGIQPLEEKMQQLVQDDRDHVRYKRIL